MSARNYSSGRDINTANYPDSLPFINPSRITKPQYQELPPLSGRTKGIINRNLNYSYGYNSYDDDDTETPFSDFFTESETDTPDFRSEESDSSSGSALRRSTAEATKILADEWAKIERTLYDEEGEKCTKPEIIDECNNWKKVHPHLRVIGKAIKLPEKRLSCRLIDSEEIIAMHYSDCEQFCESETDDRVSESSGDVTPRNSPRESLVDLSEPRLSREKVTFHQDNNNYDDLINDDFCSLLQITPIQIRSPVYKKRGSILNSEAASSKWMRNSRPDSSLKYERNSAKSFVSLDTRNSALSATNRNKMLNNRVVTARLRDSTRLEPLCSPEPPRNESMYQNGSYNYSVRKISLPPLLLEDEKKKVVLSNSAKKHNTRNRRSSKGTYQLHKLTLN